MVILLGRTELLSGDRNVLFSLSYKSRVGDVRPPPPGEYGVDGAQQNIIFPENEV